MSNKTVEIIGGGTVFHVRPHLAISAPAYGSTARRLAQICEHHSKELDVRLNLTRMAGGLRSLETNEDVDHLLTALVENPNTKIIFMTAALCDWKGSVQDVTFLSGHQQIGLTPSGREQPRLSSANGQTVYLSAADKLIGKIRKNRKDIFLVGFKATTGATEQEQYLAGLKLLKTASCNLVLANDLHTKMNMVVTPEEARYHVTNNRDHALQDLAEMAYLRSHLTFTRSTVVAGDPVPWDSPLVPSALRTVVNYCIKKNAYKPFMGATVGHFAAKLNDTTFLTSRRKTNFNDLDKLGLVKVETDGPDSVIAYGSKPSVGGQSQRIIFGDHPEYNAVVHFHCPKKPDSQVPAVSQREVECGSHACGNRTSSGLKRFGNLSAVYLDNHGPNIVFHGDINPQEVIDFIEENFDLSRKTGGYVS